MATTAQQALASFQSGKSTAEQYNAWAANPNSTIGTIAVASATPVSPVVPATNTSTTSSTNIINYDPNTGRKLNPGESVVDNATGKTVTQGTPFGSTTATPVPAVNTGGMVGAGNVSGTSTNTGGTNQAKYFISTSPTGKVYKQDLPQDSDYQSTLQFLINEANSKGNTVSYEYPTVTPATPATQTNKTIQGTYKGQNIYSGTDAEVTAQMKAIDAGTTSATPTPTAPVTPTTPTTPVAPVTSTDTGATIEYDPNTGQKLTPGQTVTDPNTGQPITQGTPFVTPPTSGTTIEYDPNTGRKLNPGETVTSNETGKSVTQGTPYVPAPDQNTTQANPNANLIQKDTAGNYVEPTGDTATKDKIASDLEAKFKEFTDTTKATQEASQKATQELLTKMGDTATQALMDKFTETQKSISDSYAQYFNQQQEYLTQLQNQPSVVDQLNKFREQQGLPQMEKELAGIDQTILTTEGLLSNIEADIRTRTEGLPVSEAAARRLTSMEQAPLSKQLSEQLRSRQYAAAGLEAKQATVNQYMTSAQADLANQKEVAQAKLGVAKEQAGVKADIANSGLEAFQTVQSQMNDVYKIELSNISSNADYQNKLAELGFDFYTQQQAQKTADINDKEAFAQELFKIKLQNTLNTTNPDYQTEIVSDSSGVFYQISINKNNPSDRIVKNLGVQGTAKSSLDSESEDKQIQSFQSDAADYITKMGSGSINWATAWSALHAKYPNASTELIDQTLGLDNRAKYDQ